MTKTLNKCQLDGLLTDDELAETQHQAKKAEGCQG